MFEKLKARFNAAKQKTRQFRLRPTNRNIWSAIDRILNHLKDSLSTSSSNFLSILKIPLLLLILLLIRFNGFLQWVVPQIIDFVDSIGRLIIDLIAAVFDEAGFYWRFFARTSEYAGFPLRHLSDKLSEQVERELAGKRETPPAPLSPEPSPSAASPVSLEKPPFADADNPLPLSSEPSPLAPSVSLEKPPLADDLSPPPPASLVLPTFTYAQTFMAAAYRVLIWGATFLLALLATVGIAVLVGLPISVYLLRPYLAQIDLEADDPYRAVYQDDSTTADSGAVDAAPDGENSVESPENLGSWEKNKGILTSLTVLLLLWAVIGGWLKPLLLTVLVLSVISAGIYLVSWISRDRTAE